MSSPDNPLESLGNLFGGGEHVYPPAPKGMHYAELHGGKPAPPGYKYQKMSEIVHPGTHSGHHRGLTQTAPARAPLTPVSAASIAAGKPPTPAPTAPAAPPAKPPAFGAGAVPYKPYDFVPMPAQPSAPLPSPAEEPSFRDEIQKLLDPFSKTGPAPKRMEDMSIQELNDLGNRAFRGESSLRDLTDTNQSRADAKAQGHRMRPEVLSQMWKNMTSPPGPSFDPHNVNLDELKYQPLPKEDEY